MGRKKLSPEEARAKFFRIRVTEAELAELERAAQAKGFRSTSTWARQELLRLARRKKSGA